MEEQRTGWRARGRALFESGILDRIFAHARNFFVASSIFTVGVYAVQKGNALHLPGILYVGAAGYLVAALGVLLLVANLADGVYRLSTFRYHTALQILLTAVYIFVSLRLAVLSIAFHG